MAARKPLPAILIDTREQLPWDFPGREVEVATLPYGDYALRAHPRALAIERKTLADWISTVTVAHYRFMREVARASADRCPLVVLIEGTVEDVLARRYRGDVHPNAVLGGTESVIAAGVPVRFCGSRTAARDKAVDLLEHAMRRVTREAKPSPEAVAF